MKRFVALVLALCMLLPLIACGTQPAAPTASETPSSAETTQAPAEQTQQEGFTVEQYRKAAQEVAMGFYYKNPHTEYEARNLTHLGKWAGAMRNSHGVPPEGISADSEHYTQCTDFVVDVYVTAYDYRMLNDRIMPGTSIYFESLKDDPGTILYWTPQSDMSINEMAKKVVEIMEPGDILATNGKDTGESVGSGHAMICVGDVLGDGKKYMMHCWGKPLPTGTKEGSDRADMVDAEGSIKLQTCEDLLLLSQKKGNEPKWNIRATTHVANFLMVYRPYLASDFNNNITPATLSRMKYSGIEIDRRPAGLTKYNDLISGENVTFELEITNHSKEAYTALPVSEVIPEGATLDAASVTEGGKADGKTVSWTLDIPAGETKLLSYTMKVDAPFGTLLTFPSGKVDNIDTRELTMMVGGKHLNETQLAAIAKFAETQQGFSFKGKDSTDVTMVEAFYKQLLGIEIDLPDTMEDFISERFVRDELASLENGATEEIYFPKPEYDTAHPDWKTMEMYQHLGGLYVAFRDEGWNSPYRMLDLKEEFYQPGDIILTMWYGNHFHANDLKYVGVYVYLGKDKVLSMNEAGELQIQTYVETLNCLLRNNIFVGLRPTLAYADINAK